MHEGIALSIPFSFKDLDFLETIKFGDILAVSFHSVGDAMSVRVKVAVAEIRSFS